MDKLTQGVRDGVHGDIHTISSMETFSWTAVCARDNNVQLEPNCCCTYLCSLEPDPVPLVSESSRGSISCTRSSRYTIGCVWCGFNLASISYIDYTQAPGLVRCSCVYLQRHQDPYYLSIIYGINTAAVRASFLEPGRASRLIRWRDGNQAVIFTPLSPPCRQPQTLDTMYCIIIFNNTRLRFSLEKPVESSSHTGSSIPASCGEVLSSLISWLIFQLYIQPALAVGCESFLLP